MADKIINVKIQEASDSEANWLSKDPILLKGQIAYTTDVSKLGFYKLGDGVSNWSALPYAKADPSSHTHTKSQITDFPTISGSGSTTVTTDKNGNIVISSTDTNTDTKVQQSISTATSFRNLLLSYNTSTTGTATTATNIAYMASGLYVQPSTGLLHATTFEGNLSGNADTATTATKIGTSTIGGSTTPIYMKMGTPTVCNTPTLGAWFNGVPYINSSGVMEMGRYIDFHPTTDSTLDYGVRIDGGTSTTQRKFTFGSSSGEFVVHTANTAIGSETQPVYISNTGTVTACTAYSSASVLSASKLTTARTIQTNLSSSSSASFDGSANITLGVTGTLPIANGGTGASTTGEATNNLYAASLAPSISVSSGSDLDDYMTLGSYYVNSSTIASTLSNTPITTSGFGLWVGNVYGPASSTYRIQTAMTYNGTTYRRYINLNSTTSTAWSAWTQLNFTDTKVTQTAITASSYTNYRPLLFGSSNGSTAGFSPTTVTDQVYAASNMYVKPSEGLIHATTFEGKLSGNASSSTYSTYVRVTPTNPETATVYYAPFIAGITAGTSYALRCNNGLRLSALEGTESASGYDILLIGNATASGTSGNKYGGVRIYSTGAYYGQITQASGTANASHILPATSGTILNTGTTSFTQSLTSGTAIGTLKINGVNKTLYAPTSTYLEAVDFTSSGDYNIILTNQNDYKDLTETSVTNAFKFNVTSYDLSISIGSTDNYTGSIYLYNSSCNRTHLCTSTVSTNSDNIVTLPYQTGIIPIVKEYTYAEDHPLYLSKGELTLCSDKYIYSAGDSETIIDWWAVGVLTSSNKQLILTYPTSKLLTNISTISLDVTTIQVRQNGSYLLGTASGATNFTGVATCSIASPGMIKITLTYSSSIGGTNNDTCSVRIQGSLNFM